ncbi:MAG: hypothetical protein P8P71_00450 [Phycisphaerales bacterium]|nr:hypothetical protein [Phycisphaerales bacterium]
MLRSFRNQVEEVKGLGDLVELATAATGIKSVVDKLSEKTGKDCGCKKRKAWLNDKIPFRRREGEH